MSIVNIISAIGNTGKITPLLVRDCGIEIPAKVVLTYNESAKESKDIAKLAARERIIDEYAVSAVWLGGIPLIDWISKKLIKRAGYNSDVNMKLLTEDEFQGIERNIKKFAGSVPDAVIKDLEKVRDNRKIFEKYTAGKFAAATLIPMVVMGVVIPKLIFASTAKRLEKRKAEEKQFSQSTAIKEDIVRFKGNISFTGGLTSSLANLTTVQKMAAVDGGYAIGRVGTARTKEAAAETAFKMAGMMFLNFVAPKWIEKALDGITGAKLDPLMLTDKNFQQELKSGGFKLPKSSKDLIEFVDANPDSLFVKFANKFGKVKMLKENPQIRDPRAYVDVKKLGAFRDAVEQFAQKAGSAKDFEKMIKKIKGAKYFNILTNIGLSSFLLAYCLPKAQYAFRELITGSSLEPGILGESKKRGVKNMVEGLKG
ncbi:MAG: hypothetical protein LBK53_01280 [Heliobacteriaceae bacterium]|jgi:hypothetical protein|nr:hypothetical protein [Heliobacteriaceae bacterium]